MTITVYEDSRGSGNCRGCNASVIWVEAVSGKRMPLNPPWRPIQTGRTANGRRLVDIDTTVTMIHFATCPHADYFRHRR
jgi:hypothetical protein